MLSVLLPKAGRKELAELAGANNPSPLPEAGSNKLAEP